MEPSRSDTARTRWLALTPPARRLKPQPQPDARARFPEEHRLPLRPAPPIGLRWGSVPADALPETLKGERRSMKIQRFIILPHLPPPYRFWRSIIRTLCLSASLYHLRQFCRSRGSQAG